MAFRGVLFVSCMVFFMRVSTAMHAPGAVRRTLGALLEQDAGILQVVPATVNTHNRVAQCEREVARHLVGDRVHELPAICAGAGFSKKACDHSFGVVFAELSHSRSHSAVAAFACRTLSDASDSEKTSTEALQRRRTAPMNSESLEMSLAQKRGQPDYLVRSADLTAPPAPPPRVEVPPIPAVDLTIAQPPDADGNPYNDPTWGENAPAPEPPSVEDAALLQVKIPVADADVLRCEHDVAQHLAEGTFQELPGLCAGAGFSELACSRAMQVMSADPSEGLTPPTHSSVAASACGALFGSTQSEEASINAMERRRASPMSMESLEMSLVGKRGQPDYLVRSADLTAPPAPPPLVEVPPVPAVDLTIAQPPDADGNPYNEPTWGENAPAPEPPSVEDS